MNKMESGFKEPSVIGEFACQTMSTILVFPNPCNVQHDRAGARDLGFCTYFSKYLKIPFYLLALLAYRGFVLIYICLSVSTSFPDMFIFQKYIQI